jgi:hydrogenase maturation protease
MNAEQKPLSISPERGTKARKASILLLACGNTLRRDDGVGRAVATEIERLKLPGVEVISCDLLLPELADQVSSVNQVIFVDAVADASRQTRIEEVKPAESPQLMAHHASPGILLALARDVFGHCPSASLVTIPASDFGIGEELSETAHQGMQQALDLILERITGV